MSNIDEKLAKDAQMVIDALGGPRAAGRRLGISAPSICAWRKNGLAHHWVKYLGALHPEVLRGTRWEVSDPVEIV